MGRVAAPHGVRGSIKVTPWCADPATLLAYKVWWVRRSDADPWREMEVMSAHLHGEHVIAELAGIGSRENAAMLRGSQVALPRARLPKPAANEYYWADLEGMDVINRSGIRLGRVKELIETGAHPVLRVMDGGERLIPFVAAYIDRVDAKARRIEVDWEADF
jgi:16S rRNA processing protein RimM